MELHQLRYVRAIAEAGSFTGAAQALYLAQPSLSVQVRKLERELGVDLFVRLGRRVELTSAGEAFLEHVETALFHLRRAREQAVAVGGLQHGRVAIGALPSVGAALVPDVLAAYRREHPGVELRLSEHNVPAEFERLVHDGKLDLAVTRAPWTRPGITGRVLIREPMVALLPPGHRMAGRDRVDLAQLAGEEFVGMRSGYGLRTLLHDTCLRYGFTPNVTVETGELSVLRGMVRSGIGVSVVPRLAARGHTPAVPLDDPAVSRALAVIWRDAVPLSPAARAFLDLLVTAADALPGERSRDRPLSLR